MRPRTNGPQNGLPALRINTERARRAHKFCGDSDTVIGPINKIRKLGPNGPFQFLLILTPDHNYNDDHGYYGHLE